MPARFDQRFSRGSDDRLRRNGGGRGSGRPIEKLAGRFKRGIELLDEELAVAAGHRRRDVALDLRRCGQQGE